MKKITTRITGTQRYTVISGDPSFAWLNSYLISYRKTGSKVLILADENTRDHCLPLLLEEVPSLAGDRVLCITPGEEGKNLETASKLWTDLDLAHADRHSLLLNLGGGVVTDLGGFVAATFKRGIPFVNIPTTLMGMADAAIGGKTAINLEGVKNQVGTFSLPVAVLLHVPFLATLHPDEIRSGFAEVAKTALIADPVLWRRLSKGKPSGPLDLVADQKKAGELVFRVASLKNLIVRSDFTEQKRRKLLNFGHTVGHAFESVRLRQGKPVSHGDAVALGMVCESYLSNKICGLPADDMNLIRTVITSWFMPHRLTPEDRDEIITMLPFDKKNAGGRTRFTLLAAPGRGRVNLECGESLVREALEYYSTV